MLAWTTDNKQITSTVCEWMRVLRPKNSGRWKILNGTVIEVRQGRAQLKQGTNLLLADYLL